MNITKGLSEQQLSVFKSKNNKILISSCAGSGKTEIVCRYALYKSVLDKSNIIVTTFTKSNINNIKKRFDKLREQFELRDNRNIDVKTIDSLVQKFINKFYPDTDGSNFSKKTRLFLKWLEVNNTYPFDIKYYFIVDEFQDTYNDLSKAKILLKLGELGLGIMAVGDIKQTLSKPKEGDNQMVFDLFRNTLNPHEIILNKTRRFGKNIAKFVNKVTGQDIQYNKNIESHKPFIIFHEKLSDKYNAENLALELWNMFISKWIIMGCELRDIAIIQRKSKNDNNYIFSALEYLLKKNNHNVVWYQKDSSCKETYNIVDDKSEKGKITLCSIMFSKGSEWRKVILLNCTEWSLPFKTEHYLDLIPQSTFNVGITRAIEELVVTVNLRRPSSLLKPLCRDDGYINTRYVNLMTETDMILNIEDNKIKKDKILNGVVEIAEELADYELEEIDDIIFTKHKIKNTEYLKFNQYYEEYQLKHLYGIIGELLITRELYLNYNNLGELNFYLFVKKYNNKIIIKTKNNSRINNINIFLNTYRSKYDYYKNILFNFNININSYRNMMLENTKDKNNKYSYSKWGGREIFEKLTRMMYDKNIPIILKEEEIIDKHFFTNIENSIKEYLDKSVKTKDLSKKCLFYLSCISDLEKGRLGIIKYDGIWQSHFNKLISNIKKTIPILNYNSLVYQKQCLYKIKNYSINGISDFFISESNNPLELSKIRLQVSKLIYNSLLSEDIIEIISFYLSKIFNCSEVIEIKCSSSTSMSKEWKIQVLLYMCMNNCNKSRLFNIMKGIYWDCKLPKHFNKKLFIKEMYKKTNKNRI
mgnify:CR=1 FL=1